ncbi:DUF4880 domain-containing protein [Pseudomonas aeruginosa]
MNSPQEQQQIRQQAAEWAIRLDGGDLDRSRREALDGWLAADPGTRPRWRWRNGPGNSWDRWPNRGRWFRRRSPARRAAPGGGARAGAAGPRRRRCCWPWAAPGANATPA